MCCIIYIHCILCITLYSLYYIYCLLALHYMHCIICSALYAVNSMHCILYILLYAMNYMYWIFHISFYSFYSFLLFLWIKWIYCILWKEKRKKIYNGNLQQQLKVFTIFKQNLEEREKLITECKSPCDPCDLLLFSH